MARLAPPESALYLTYHSTSQQLGKVLDEFWDQTTVHDRELLRALVGRLVRVPLPNENTPLVAACVARGDLSDGSSDLIGALLKKTVLKIDRHPESGLELLCFSDPHLTDASSRLRGLVDEDRRFLVWRQRMMVGLAEWEADHKNAKNLLSGSPLDEAEHWLNDNPQGINAREREFVELSLAALGGTAVSAVARAQEMVDSLPAARVQSARRVLLRLLRVARPEEGDQHTRRRAAPAEFAADDQPVLEELQRLGVVTRVTSSKPGEVDGFELADDTLVHDWPWLRVQVDADRERLTARQLLWQRIQDWNERDDSVLLRGPDLARVNGVIAGRADYFNDNEQAFVAASMRGETERQRRAWIETRWRRVGYTLIVLMMLGFAWVLWLR